MNDKMELTHLDRLLYEIDPLGTATTYTVTREQLEALTLDSYTDGYDTAYEDWV